MHDNKDHWYDGRFYDLLIAPHQDTMFARVKGLMKNGSTVLDVGCGTGRLAFQLADKCRRIDGVDLSKRNIEVAGDKLASHSAHHITFHHADIFPFLQNAEARFDYAVLTYVLHEMDETVRGSLLEVLSKAAREVIIVDYLVPQPRGIVGAVNELIEYVAGWGHYRNFKSFLAAGGLIGATTRAGLTIVREERNDPYGNHVLVVAAQSPGLN